MPYAIIWWHCYPLTVYTNCCAALAGLCVMIVLIPFNAVMMRYLTRVRKRLVLCTDARVKLTSEIVSGIKAIKLYAWEVPFRRRVEKLREAEMKEIRATVIIGELGRMFYFIVIL